MRCTRTGGRGSGKLSIAAPSAEPGARLVTGEISPARIDADDELAKKLASQPMELSWQSMTV